MIPPRVFLNIFVLFCVLNVCTLTPAEILLKDKSESSVPDKSILPVQEHNVNVSTKSKNDSHTLHDIFVPQKNSSVNNVNTKKKPNATHSSPTPSLAAPKTNTSEVQQGMVTNTINFQRINSGALLRGFYVFVGLSVIVVMYLVVRSIRLGRKVSRVHKYGILANREDVEMTPLGADDEDDDTIVFDLSNHPPS